MPDFVPTEPFVPMRGLGNPHAQTIGGVLLRPGAIPPLRRERWNTPDGDFLDADVLPAEPSAPHVLVLHGLEGSSHSGYVIETLRQAQQRGWGALALNFRSCSGEPNRTIRAYNSGDTTDARQALKHLRERTTGPLLGIGFSLGASVLLNLLAQDGDQSALTRAAAVSTPFDLAGCARSLDGGSRWIVLYRAVFLRTLRAKALGKARRFPGKVDVKAIRAAKGIASFDDAFTAPIYGYRDAAEYYAHCSSGPQLSAIRRPTLAIHSEDDPLVPGSTLPARDAAAVQWLITQRGGHVGFVSGTAAQPKFWAETQAIAFLAQ